MNGTQPPLRTVLFVPGNDRRKIEKAFGLGASAVMLDLEDAVAASEKAAARAVVCESALAAPEGGAARRRAHQRARAAAWPMPTSTRSPRRSRASP